jgi:hypothetical protein
MNLNDQLHFYSIFDLTPFPLKLRNEISLVHGANEHDPAVGEPQRHLAKASTNIGTPCGKNLAIKDSTPILTSALAFLANSRSPPLSNRLLFTA